MLLYFKESGQGKDLVSFLFLFPDSSNNFNKMAYESLPFPLHF